MSGLSSREGGGAHGMPNDGHINFRYLPHEPPNWVCCRRAAHPPTFMTEPRPASFFLGHTHLLDIAAYYR